MSGSRLEIEKMVSERCFELAATRAVTAAGPGAGWPVEPGACSRDAAGKIEMLHFAPGRWLLPAPSPELLARVTAFDAVECVDVEGKWQRRLLRGKRALRALAAGADVHAILSNRDCAALALFDCPVILARSGDAFRLWVHASYAAFLDEQLVAADAAANRPSAGAP